MTVLPQRYTCVCFYLSDSAPESILLALCAHAVGVISMPHVANRVEVCLMVITGARQFVCCFPKSLCLPLYLCTEFPFANVMWSLFVMWSLLKEVEGRNYFGDKHECEAGPAFPSVAAITVSAY